MTNPAQQAQNVRFYGDHMGEIEAPRLPIRSVKWTVVKDEALALRINNILFRRTFERELDCTLDEETDAEV